MDVDLRAVRERHLDLVGAFLVACLGVGHPAAAGVGERRLGCTGESGAR